jgi:hypothetical protein
MDPQEQQDQKDHLERGMRAAQRQYEPRTLPELEEIAGNYNCTFFREEPGFLTIDIDCDNASRIIALEHFHDRLEFLNSLFDQGDGAFLQLQNSWKSRNGGWHVLLKFNQNVPVFTLDFRITLALALGSDYKREMLALRHHMLGIDMNIGLFKPKEAS